MDFFRIKQRRGKNGTIEVYPDFIVCRSKDMMIRAKSFYAIWDEEAGLWSTDEYDVQRLVDQELYSYEQRLKEKTSDPIHVMYLSSFASGSWTRFQSYIKALSDNSQPLDETVTFANTNVRKEDYVSRRLPYSLGDGHGQCNAYRELATTLYDPQELEKLEWAIGAVISGDASWIQKFIVLYGAPGSGKSTYINIIERLFEGYVTSFEAKALVGNNNNFATEAFRGNPLVAIQHDGSLARIEDNTKLNSIVGHDMMLINEKNKPTYNTRMRAFLFMGTNKPVKITDANSGIIRRLIDVNPSGRKVTPRRYQALVAQIGFELGDIAKHCLDVYDSMGPDYYDGYVALEMMLQTNSFFNFVEENYRLFDESDGITLEHAYILYKQFCEDSGVEYPLSKFKFRDELRLYFKEFDIQKRIDGEKVRSYYSGFDKSKFVSLSVRQDELPMPLVLSDTKSALEEIGASWPAQYANDYGTPSFKWDDVTTTLGELDTSRTHYVNVPEDVPLIVIDFDLKNEDGEKDLELNLAEASKWPPTSAEPSKSGNGIHLHYFYDGDPAQLGRIFKEGVEIKVFTGNASLRRRHSITNGRPIATLSGGLPIKEKKVLNQDAVKSEKGLRRLIVRNLQKEIHPATRPSVDFIHKILEDAYDSGLVYDVSDMYDDIWAFASNSSNQAMYCMKTVLAMKFASKETHEEVTVVDSPSDDRVVIFDCEVFPNLFLVSWGYEDADEPVSMINPAPEEVGELLKMKLVGYNCRKYDNHILHAAALGYDNTALYNLSKRIVSNDRSALFGQAYQHSYVDIYDMASKKQSLKLWEIDLGIYHLELGLPWDKPVPEELWPRVQKYCENDWAGTKAVWKHLQGDFTARKILAELSGRAINDTTQQHTAAIVFNKQRNVDAFVYTDLSEQFPGYTWDITTTGVVSRYRGEVVGEGGRVRAKPGMYSDVAVLDVASMHPNSIKLLNLFGDTYTDNFYDLVRARLAIKHRDYEAARQMFGGRLAPYLKDESTAKALAYALKIAINIVYGLTAANFPNAFNGNDPQRNKDNIVAKRGALFMMDLEAAVEERGFEVIHTKTDSVKIPGATKEIIDFVIDFGKQYGYDFEHEHTYEKMCLVNDAVYIAKIGWSPDESEIGKWTATGAQFAEPYVFKTLFSHEDILFSDLIQKKSVTTALYLDFNAEKPMALADYEEDPHFVGRVGAFVPVEPGTGGGTLLRLDKSGEKFVAATGSKGCLWKEAFLVESLGQEDTVDLQYYENLVYEARTNLGKYGDVTLFLD